MDTNADNTIVQEVFIQSQDDKMYLVFQLRGSSYGIGTFFVKGILTLPELAKPPQAPECVAGVMTFHNKQMFVLDTRHWLGWPQMEAGQDARVIVVEEEQGKPLGLMVDGVSGIVHVPDSEVQLLPETPTSGKSILRGVVEINGEVIFLVDIPGAVRRIGLHY